MNRILLALAIALFAVAGVHGQDRFVPFDPARTCEDKDAPRGLLGAETSRCWQQLNGRPGCYVYRSSQSGDAATWTGSCNGSVADGEGVLTWLMLGRAVIEPLLGEGVWAVEQGTFDNGRRIGRWVVRFASGSYAELPYVNGNMHGTMIYRFKTFDDLPAWTVPDCVNLDGYSLDRGCRDGFSIRYVNGERQEDP